MATTTDILDEVKHTFALIQKEMKRQDTEIQDYGHARAETLEAMDRLTERCDELETKLMRPPVPNGQAGPDEAKDAENGAFEKYLRYGKGGIKDRLSEPERKAWEDINSKSLTSSEDTQGGVFIPEDFRTEVIRKLPNFANVGGLVTRQTTSRDTLSYPRINWGTDDIHTSGIAVTWEGENPPVSETDFNTDQVRVPIHKARALVKVSTELLEDSAVDVVNLLTDLFAETYAIEEDRVFTVGSGGTQPEGFLSNTLIQTINAQASAYFDYDDLVDLVHTLPQQYTANAVFMCKRKTIGYVRKLKDGFGHPLWQPSVAMGQPPTLLGFSIYVNEQMPSHDVLNATPLIFGDFRQLYLVADRVDVSVQRLNERYADTDEVGFIVRRRLGGKVKGEWAAKLLKVVDVTL